MNTAASPARLVSVNVGKPQTIDWNGRSVYTGIGKRPVHGSVMARRLNLDGDGQGDLAGHGGEQRAVLAYQTESYRQWEEFLGIAELEPGVLGENLTVDGLPDDEVCIGDRYRIGEAIFEVTQPRVTCFRAGIRIGVPQMANLLVSHRRPGFYLRVITEGTIRAGDTIERIRQGPFGLSVAEVDGLLYLPDADHDRLQKALRIPALSPGWRTSFEELLQSPEATSQAPALSAGTEPPSSGFTRLKITELVHETSAVLSVHLSATDSGQLPTPRAGQFLTIRIPPEAGFGTAVRSYSLSATTNGNQEYRISIKNDPRGTISGWLHQHLGVGQTLEVVGPTGEFYLQQADTNPVVLLSAGIGITPLLAMLQELARDHSEREVWWVHSTQNETTYAFAAEAQGFLDQLAHSHAATFFTRDTGRRPGVINRRIDSESLKQLGLPATASAFVCGPSAFIADMQAALATLGLDPAHVHTELFRALASINPGIVGESARTPHQPAGEPGDGPAITFTRSGITVPWAPGRYQSLLELAEACDIPTRWSCRSGVCHTCVTRRLSGRTRYTSPAPLIDPGTDDVLLCSAEPVTDIVLDA